MRNGFKLGMAALLLAICGMSPLPAGAQVQSANGGTKPVVLDRVVAIINGDVLLESDVQEELHFARLEPLGTPSGTDSLRRAARRLINRTLILQQMKQQQQAGINVSNSDVQKDLQEVRTHLARCKPYDCATEAGWKSFLAANDLTEQEVQDHWKQRMEILRFIDIRFRTGIRISNEEIADYYQKSIVPGYAHDQAKPPPLEALAPRIREVLLQQHVNGLLQDWMKSLRDEGSVRILDPAYGQSSGGQEDEDQ
jgi:peptidyl-prolyl cis-trans isomerase SurA